MVVGGFHLCFKGACRLLKFCKSNYDSTSNLDKIVADAHYKGGPMSLKRQGASYFGDDDDEDDDTTTLVEKDTSLELPNPLEHVMLDDLTATGSEESDQSYTELEDVGETDDTNASLSDLQEGPSQAPAQAPVPGRKTE